MVYKENEKFKKSDKFYSEKQFNSG